MSAHVLEMRGICKRFPGVTALDDAQLALRPGEAHCLVGENGAGKSTLMKILAGAERADAGRIVIQGEPVSIASPLQAQRLGISMIYQEFNLSPYLSVAENIFLGHAPTRGRTPFIAWRRLYADAEALLARIGAPLDVRRPVYTLSVAQQQMVEIAKALAFDARVIVMDEPSATLTGHELRALFELIKTLRRQGLAVVYISHRLEEIFAVGQQVTVMRDGRHIATRPVSDVTREDLIQMMVGRNLDEEFPRHRATPAEEVLRVEGFTRAGAFEDVSLTLRAGEIAGLTGLVGAGRTEVARAIFGADPRDAGTLYLRGRPVHVRNPRDAIAQGIGLLTEDRKNQGLVLDMSVRENVTLANLGALVRGGFVRRGPERAAAQRYTRELRIKTPSIDQATRNLSGGNQQKVVLAKWLFTQSRVLIFDEPTRGVDVGAKVEIYKLINTLVESGAAVLIISSELPEVLGLCDRIAVMHEGRMAGAFPSSTATQAGIMRLATGGHAEAAA